MIKALARLSTAILAVSLVTAQPLGAQQETSADQTEEMHPDVAMDLVLEARKSVRLVDMDSFRQAVRERNYDLLIDVREPSEFDAGHIPGAINIPRGLIEFKIWPTVGFPDVTDQGQKIFLYCNTGVRASLSGVSLEELGFTDVRVVDMKLTDWIEAGLPMEETH
jgi:rhodanese-related sulfurtransferase